jgi:hypothetical protein
VTSKAPLGVLGGSRFRPERRSSTSNSFSQLDRTSEHFSPHHPIMAALCLLPLSSRGPSPRSSQLSFRVDRQVQEFTGSRKSVRVSTSACSWSGHIVRLPHRERASFPFLFFAATSRTSAARTPPFLIVGTGHRSGLAVEPDHSKSSGVQRKGCLGGAKATASHLHPSSSREGLPGSALFSLKLCRPSEEVSVVSRGNILTH